MALVMISANNPGSKVRSLAHATAEAFMLAVGVGLSDSEYRVAGDPQRNFGQAIKNLVVGINTTTKAKNSAPAIGNWMLDRIKVLDPELYYAMGLAFMTRMGPGSLRNNVEVIIQEEVQTDPSEPPEPGLFYIVWTTNDEMGETVHDYGGMTQDPQSEWEGFVDQLCTYSGGDVSSVILKTTGRTLGKEVIYWMGQVATSEDHVWRPIHSPQEWRQALRDAGYRFPTNYPNPAIINRHGSS